jgi:hypothetical protein
MLIETSNLLIAIETLKATFDIIRFNDPDVFEGRDIAERGQLFFILPTTYRTVTEHPVAVDIAQCRQWIQTWTSGYLRHRMSFYKARTQRTAGGDIFRYATDTGGDTLVPSMPLKFDVRELFLGFWMAPYGARGGLAVHGVFERWEDIRRAIDSSVVPLPSPGEPVVSMDWDNDDHERSVRS